MRTAAILAVASLLATPSLAEAKRDRARPARARQGGGSPHAGATAPAPAFRLAPPAATAPRYALAPRPGAYRAAPYGYRTYPGAFVAAPLWWGWGWGYGYYPLYPRPEPSQYAPGDPERVVTTLAATAAGMRDGAAAGIALGIEGRRTGFDASIDAVSVDSVTGGGALSSSSAIGWGTMHVTWSLVSDDSARIRLELGGSMLSMPTGGAAAGTPWEGRVGFGPDVGVSGQLGLLGPIGVEGHARLTPLPVPVSDLRAAVAFRGGPLAVTAGWRAIDVKGDGTDAPSMRFSGPELGLALVF